MRRVRACERHGDDRGTAAIEFIFAGVILLVPLLYLVVALGTIQEQAFGAQATARQIARALATAPQDDVGAQRVAALRRSTPREYGIDPGRLRVSVTCMPASAHCPEQAQSVRVMTTVRVDLPLMPDVFGLRDATGIPVSATVVHPVQEGGVDERDH